MGRGLQYNRNLAKYDATLKNYQYKIEESIADKYAIAMCEHLGCNGNTIAIEKKN